MGAGAVGGYYGGMLARAGHRVTLIARPAHVQAIHERGLRLQTQAFDEAVTLSASTEAQAVAGADLVLGGHIHLPSVMRVDALRPLWCVQAGTAVSARVREGTNNSVNQLVWAGGGAGRPMACTLTRWDWSETAGAFETASRRTLALSG